MPDGGLRDYSPLSLYVHVPTHVASKAYGSAREIAYMIRQTCFRLNRGQYLGVDGQTYAGRRVIRASALDALHCFERSWW